LRNRPALISVIADNQSPQSWHRFAALQTKQLEIQRFLGESTPFAKRENRYFPRLNGGV
jgi:hypothetical protein